MQYRSAAPFQHYFWGVTHYSPLANNRRYDSTVGRAKSSKSHQDRMKRSASRLLYAVQGAGSTTGRNTCCRPTLFAPPMKSQPPKVVRAEKHDMPDVCLAAAACLRYPVAQQACKKVFGGAERVRRGKPAIKLRRNPDLQNSRRDGITNKRESKNAKTAEMSAVLGREAERL